MTEYLHIFLGMTFHPVVHHTECFYIVHHDKEYFIYFLLCMYQSSSIWNEPEANLILLKYKYGYLTHQCII